MMKSIRVKLVFWVCALFIFIGALIYIPLSNVLPQKIASQILKRDLETAQQLSREAKQLLLLNDKIALSLFLYGNLDSLEDAQYLFVQGPSGEVIAHTFSEGFPRGLLKFNPVHKGHKIRKFLSNEKEMYDIAVPILDGSIGILHLGVSLESGKKDIAAIRKINYYVGVIILLGLGIGIAIFLIIGFLFSNQIIKLKNFAAKIGKGDFSETIDVKSHDEIGVLASALNEMALNLREKIQELKMLHVFEERNRIALDLHDGFAQDMASIIKRLELIKKLFKINPHQAYEEIGCTRARTKDVLDRIREVILGLKSPEATPFDFLENLENHIKCLKEHDNIHVEFRMEESLNKIISAKAEIIFYIVAEALNNIKKHSMAKNVKVSLGSNCNNHIVIDIQDDGKGFDIDKIISDNANKNNLGLISMRKRTSALGGTFVINSVSQQGTHICIDIPLNEIVGEVS